MLSCICTCTDYVCGPWPELCSAYIELGMFQHSPERIDNPESDLHAPRIPPESS